MANNEHDQFLDPIRLNQRSNVMANDLYTTEINDTEKDAGFTVAEIASPRGQYAFEADTIQAVVCPIDKSNRVVKMEWPNGFVTYKHQRYGIWAYEEDSDDPDWKPVGDGIEFDSDSASAVARAKALTGEEVDPKIVERVP